MAIGNNELVSRADTLEIYEFHGGTLSSEFVSDTPNFSGIVYDLAVNKNPRNKGLLVYSQFQRGTELTYLKDSSLVMYKNKDNSTVTLPEIRSFAGIGITVLEGQILHSTGNPTAINIHLTKENDFHEIIKAMIPELPEFAVTTFQVLNTGLAIWFGRDTVVTTVSKNTTNIMDTIKYQLDRHNRHWERDDMNNFMGLRSFNC